MARASRMTSIPSWPTSSRRPMNGLTYAAPAFAAIRHCTLEKHNVTLVLIPASARRRTATIPASSIGIFTTMLCELLALANHGVGVHRHHFRGDGTVHQGADLLEDVAGVQVTRLFREQRGVG